MDTRKIGFSAGIAGAAYLVLGGQYVPPTGYPSKTCSAGQAITAIVGGRATCAAVAGVTNGAGANVVTKSDGTNLVASSVSDNGTTVSTSEAVSFGGSLTTTSTTAATTFANGPAGVNAYGGTHLEWANEWANGVIQPTAALNWPIDGTWTASSTASNSFTVGAGTTTRPGIVEFSTLTSGTGAASIMTSTGLVDFGSGNWTFEAVVGFPTLSVSAQEYAAVRGFGDTSGTSSLAQVDGCWFEYDRGNVTSAPGTGAGNTSNFDKWECWCSQNSTRTAYVMDGTIVSSGSFTTVNAPIAALTLPSTNIYHLKIVMTTSTLAEFYVNNVKSCQITTNIPTGATRLTGAVMALLKSNGATARTMDVDWTRIAEDMTAARSP